MVESRASVLHIAIPHQCENRALRDHEVRISLERDLDGGLAEKERVVAGAGLDGNESRFPQRSSPRLIAAFTGVRHWKPGSRRDDLATLHCLAVHRRGRDIYPDLRALLAFLHVYEDAIADDDETLVVLVHEGL